MTLGLTNHSTESNIVPMEITHWQKKTIRANPFIPKSGIEPKVFIGRESEVEIFEQKLEEAINLKRYDHFLILGDWGIGKTSLLREFKKIAQSNEILCVMIQIRIFQEEENFLSATWHMLSSLANLPVKHKIIKGFVEYTKGMEINLPIIGGGVKIPERKEVQPDPQVLLINALKKLWNTVKRETKALVVLLDDVQNYRHISDYLTIIKNALSEETIVENTGFLFVLSSTPGAWNQFLERHHPIGRYFAPIVKLKRLAREKVLEILDKTLEGTGVVFDDVIKRKVYEYSEGHPFELQVLCSYLYDNQIAGKVNENIWEASLNMTIDHLGDVLFNQLYDKKASKSEKDILKVIAEDYKPIESQSITKRLGNSKRETINKHLNRLVEKKLLIKKERGIFVLPDRMIREYIIRKVQ